MSALDDALTQAEFGAHPDMDIAPAWAELAQLRADLQAAQERIAEQARQLDKARIFAEYVSRRALWTESTLSHSAAIWLAANPAPEAEPQP